MNRPGTTWAAGAACTAIVALNVVMLGHSPVKEIEKLFPRIEEYPPNANYREWVRAQLATSESGR